MSKQTIPTREDMARNVIILNGDVEIEENEKKAIKDFYKEFYKTFNLGKIYDKDINKSYDYYITLIHWCDLKSLCFKNLLDVLIDAEIEEEISNRNINEVEVDQFKKNYKDKIIKSFDIVKNSPASAKAMMASDSGYILEEMMENSFNEAKRLIDNYITELKVPFTEINNDIDTTDMLLTKSHVYEVFKNKKAFTKLVNDNHGLKPLIQKGDIIFYTQDEKIIHLPFLRGLVKGLIKKIIINSIDMKAKIDDQKNVIKYLTMSNDDGSLNKKIDDAKDLILFLDWANDHKRVIEYYDIAKSMGLKNNETRSFAVKISSNPGKSFKNNVDKLMNSEPHNIDIDRFIKVVDDYDRVLLFGMEEEDI